jgi:hypothetical protein
MPISGRIRECIHTKRLLDNVYSYIDRGGPGLSDTYVETTKSQVNKPSFSSARNRINLDFPHGFLESVYATT